jgi:hypothetical protein
MTLAQARKISLGIGLFSLMCWIWIVLMSFVLPELLLPALV